jgi:hypothetical protein
MSDCDPNADDDCLCGPFFDDVASCTASFCNIGENLGKFHMTELRFREMLTNFTAALDFMEQACN